MSSVDASLWSHTSYQTPSTTSIPPPCISNQYEYIRMHVKQRNRSLGPKQSRTNTSLIYQDHRYQLPNPTRFPIHIMSLERDGGTSLYDVRTDAAIIFKGSRLTCFLSPPSSKCLVRFRTSWCLTLQTVHSRRRTTFLVCMCERAVAIVDIDQRKE
jgi:hypothetical protein